MRKKLAETKLTPQNVSKVFHEYMNEFKISSQAMQTLYDKETNLSINEKKQLEWDIKIKKELEVSKQYANPIIKIRWK